MDEVKPDGQVRIRTLATNYPDAFIQPVDAFARSTVLRAIDEEIERFREATEGGPTTAITISKIAIEALGDLRTRFEGGTDGE